MIGVPTFIFNNIINKIYITFCDILSDLWYLNVTL